MRNTHHTIQVGDTVKIETHNCQHSPKKGKVLEIRGEWVTLDIHNRGGGIKMSQLEKMGTIDISGWNIQQKRDLLNLNGGRFFSLMWIKKDGSLRQATCKHWQHDLFSKGHKDLAQANTVAHKPEYYTAIDLRKEKKDAWVNIDLNTLFYIKINSLTYVDLSSEHGKRLNLENN